MRLQEIDAEADFRFRALAPDAGHEIELGAGIAGFRLAIIAPLDAGGARRVGEGPELQPGRLDGFLVEGQAEEAPDPGLDRPAGQQVVAVGDMDRAGGAAGDVEFVGRADIDRRIGVGGVEIGFAPLPVDGDRHADAAAVGRHLQHVVIVGPVNLVRALAALWLEQRDLPFGQVEFDVELAQEIASQHRHLVGGSEITAPSNDVEQLVAGRHTVDHGVADQRRADLDLLEIDEGQEARAQYLGQVEILGGVGQDQAVDVGGDQELDRMAVEAARHEDLIVLDPHMQEADLLHGAGGIGKGRPGGEGQQGQQEAAQQEAR